MSLYLLSGGAGFIGTNFAINFLKNDKHKSDTLLIIDKFSYCSNNLVNTIKDKRLIVIKEDLLNYEAVNKIFTKFKIDYIRIIYAILYKIVMQICYTFLLYKICLDLYRICYTFFILTSVSVCSCMTIWT